MTNRALRIIYFITISTGVIIMLLSTITLLFCRDLKSSSITAIVIGCLLMLSGYIVICCEVIR